MKFGTWLLAMMQPMVAKVLLALGFQVVTITGVVVSVTTLKNLFVSHMGVVPAAGFQLAMLAGCGEGFGMIFGAITFRVALWQIGNATKILGANT